MKSFLFGATALIYASMANVGAIAYEVKEVGSLHIGGKTATLSSLPAREIVFSPGSPPVKVDPNGEFEVGQMYASYVKLAAPISPYPILFWHGGGLTGVTWETKPDGASGWQQFVLAAGYDTYVSDAVERGRASWARYPEIYKSEPFFRTKKEAWTLFRIGTAYEVGGARVAYPDTKFPVASFDQFMKQSVPRWATNDELIQQAYDAYVKTVCPCILVVHSQAGNFAFTAALNNPSKIKALIAIEPSGFPEIGKVDLTTLKDVPHLFVYGDHLVGPFWEKVFANATQYRNALASSGVKADLISLPSMGIVGNSHMLMMDSNSDQIAKLVTDWLAENVK